MATKNIEININNGNGYDILYPKTVMANITDWQNNVYSKSQTYSRSEVYSRSETYTKNEVNSLLGSGSGLKGYRGSYKGTGTTTSNIYVPAKPYFIFIKDSFSCDQQTYDYSSFLQCYPQSSGTISSFLVAQTGEYFVDYMTKTGASRNEYGNLHFTFSGNYVSLRWDGSTNASEAVANQSNYTYYYLLFY